MRAVLLSYTMDPIGTVVTTWFASKTEKPLEQIRAELTGQDYLELFQRIIDQGIPVAQNVVFNFICEDVPISWREQAVRHRIGVKYGDNFAVDIVPEMDSSFWSQSMRIQDMSKFAEQDKYYIPASIDNVLTAVEIYAQMMFEIQEAYSKLIALGIPMEDARNLIPLGATHRISMTINLQALQHIIGKRSCWILQGSLWEPIIESMIDELVTKVHQVFRRLVNPPCVEGGEFRTCVFKEENRRRMDRRDNLPVCPLYATEQFDDPTRWMKPDQVAATNSRVPQYAKFWDQPELQKTWEWERRI